MNFNVSTKDIKTREILEAEGSLSKTVDLMARFAFDDSGQRIPEDAAREMLLDMSLDDLTDIQTKFIQAVLPNLKGRR